MPQERGTRIMLPDSTSPDHRFQFSYTRKSMYNRDPFSVKSPVRNVAIEKPWPYQGYIPLDSIQFDISQRTSSSPNKNSVFRTRTTKKGGNENSPQAYSPVTTPRILSPTSLQQQPVLIISTDLSATTNYTKKHPVSRRLKHHCGTILPESALHQSPSFTSSTRFSSVISSSVLSSTKQVSFSSILSLQSR